MWRLGESGGGAHHGYDAVADFLALADAVVVPAIALNGPNGRRLGLTGGVLAADKADVGVYEIIGGGTGCACDLTLKGEATAAADKVRLPGDEGHVTVGVDTRGFCERHEELQGSVLCELVSFFADLARESTAEKLLGK